LDYGIYPNFSPDGETIVYTNGGIRKLSLLDLIFTRITTNTFAPNGIPTNIDWSPVYSPNGALIAFSSWRPISASDTIVFNHWDVMIMNADGTNQRPLVQRMYQWCGAPAFSPTGDRIAFTRHTGADEYYISTMGQADSTWHDIVRAPNTPTTKANFDPDGIRVYFQSGYPAGMLELYWVSAAGGSYQMITNNQVADTDPYVHSAWVYE
jgi:Tol biopolymer transport system component